MLYLETKNLERLMDYTVMSLTNPHTIRGRPTLKDVERFRNGSFHEFCRLKALITLKEVNTSDVETRKNVYEQNFDDEVKNNKQIVVNLPLLFNNLILFPFFMDTCNEQLDISYIINIIVQVMINVVLFYAWSSTLQHTENCLQNCNVLEKGNNFAHVHEYNDMPVSRNFYVYTYIKFSFANKIKAMYERPHVQLCKRKSRNSLNLTFNLNTLCLTSI